MSATPPRSSYQSANGGDKTPELTTKREKRHREDDEEDDRDVSGRSHRYRREDDRDYDRDRSDRGDRDRDRERRHRHRRRDETEEERRERHRRREEETEEEREERHRRRRERELRERGREREREDDYRRGSREMSVGRPLSHRDRSRESHRSYRSHRDRDEMPPIRPMSREPRDMAEERRENDRRREMHFADLERDGRMRSPPPRRRRLSPEYGGPRGPPPRRPPPPPPRDPATALIEEVDSEARSIFVSQLSARMTSQVLGLFFEDKLGRGAVRDARVVTDKVARRSKGIGYVELDSVDLVNKAFALSGTVVMGIPINIMLTEAERNHSGTELITATALASNARSHAGGGRSSVPFTQNYPPLSTGLDLPPGLDPDAHKDAAIPYHRLFVSNLAFSLTADDVRQVFEPFGEIEFVDLHMDLSGLRKGTAYVQFKDVKSAQMALDAMAGFDLAGRLIKVQTIQERGTYQTPDLIEDSGNYGTRLDANQRQQLMFKLARTEPNVNLSLSAPRINGSQSKVPAMDPTPRIVVHNMFNPEEETERNWDLDLAEDVKGEVESKYGRVKRIKVEKMSAGEVYIEFIDTDSAIKAVKGLNGRFFGGRQLQAGYITEALFNAHL
ncbi:hypothetical protein LQV05_005323 [Cryptococcus neoformans]|nr:RNA-binding protein 39 [Cryptococcus neoformans var. grubii]OXC60928.1 RNA-binding protein 39 [Cryptococcus neoformans var. grubii MW-RSA852]UOH82615.1 hypothetical protein LQV05_005323 [Cryptococcus neoformans]